MISAMTAYCQNQGLPRRNVGTDRTYFEVGESTAFTSCHPLEIASTEPQVPQPKLFGLGLESLKHGRHNLPPLCAMFWYLRMEQSFRGKDILLEGVNAYPLETDSAYLQEVDKRAEHRLCPFGEERLDLSGVSDGPRCGGGKGRAP